MISQPRKRSTQRGRTTLRLELLEERITPTTFTVTDLTDNAADPGSIRSALSQVNADASAAADTIDLTGRAGTIVLQNGVLAITRTTGSVAVAGPGASTLTISGDGAGSVFSVGSGVAASISGLTIADGLAYHGGGINNNGTLAVTDCQFTGDKALPEVLYVTNYPGADSISDYSALSGATINSTLVTGLASPSSVVDDGAGHLFVANFNGNSVGEYNAGTGAVINPSLISGLSHPLGLALDGAGHLYVSNYGTNSVGEFNTSDGSPVNPSLLTGLEGPAGLALDGLGDLFVANFNGNSIGEYSATSGLPVSPALVTGLDVPVGIALNGIDLYVANNGNNSIGEFNAVTGNAISPALVTNLNGPAGLALDGSGDLYVANYGGNSIGEYSASTGNAIKAALITGLTSPVGIAVVALPSPGDGLANVGGGISNTGTLTVSGSTFNADTAVSGGGGISNAAGGTLTVTDSTFSGNSDGIASSGILSVSAGTIAGNTGNGIANTGSAAILSTIVAGNGTDVSGSLVTGESAYDLIGTTGSGGLSNGSNNNQVNVANPGLNVLANYGGPTLTIALENGSPALQKGSSLLTQLADPLAAGNANTQLTVDDGTFLGVGMVIAVDSEQMLITAVNANIVMVTRGYNSTSAVMHNAGADVVIPTDQRGFARSVSGFTDIGALETQAVPVLIRGIAVNGSTAPILSATVSAGTVTITTDGASGFAMGQSVLIAGVNGTGTASGFNGAFTISNIIASGPGAPGFSYADAGATGSSSDNGTATVAGSSSGLLSGGQRSMVDSIVYVFNQAVQLGAGAFTITVLGQGGRLPAVSYASPDGGLTWVVAFHGSGVVGNSIANGEYQVVLNSSAVSGASGGGTLAASDTETFYRLYGDTVGNGHQRVNSTDTNAYLGTFGSRSTSTAFLAYLDFNDDGVINSTDTNAFLADFNVRYSGFTPTI